MNLAGIVGALMVRYAFARELIRTKVADVLSANTAEWGWQVLLVGGGAVLRRLVRQASG